MGQLALRSEIPAQLVHEPLHFTLEPAQTNAPLLQEAVHQFVLFRVMSLLADKCPNRLLQLRVRNLVLVVTDRINEEFFSGREAGRQRPQQQGFYRVVIPPVFWEILWKLEIRTAHFRNQPRRCRTPVAPCGLLDLCRWRVHSRSEERRVGKECSCRWWLQP